MIDLYPMTVCNAWRDALYLPVIESGAGGLQALSAWRY